MPRSDDLRLADMREACDRITSICARGRAAFDGDEAVQPALERLLEILGEAATHVGEERRSALPDVDWAAVTKLRIRLAHHYHRVSPELV